MSGLDLLIGNNTIVLLCRWLLVLFVILNIRSAFQRNGNSGTGYISLFLVMLLYCVFNTPVVGDNYATMNTYYTYLSGGNPENLHFEKIYFKIMDLVPFGYVYYRIVLWGAACFLYVWLMKKMQVKSQIATLSVLAFALPLLLYYQRAAFAYVLLYTALYNYVTQGGLFRDHSFFGKHYRITSIALLMCTIPFHTTMPVYVAILLLALFVPKNKIGLAILFIGILAFSVSIVSFSISFLDFFQEDTRETGLNYLENSGAIVGQNFNGYLAYHLRLLPIYCMLLFGFYKMIKNPNYFTEFEKACLVNTFILIAISSFFSASSFAIQIKFRNAAMMPWTVFIASYFMRYRGSSTCSVYALSTIFVMIFL